MTFPWFGCMCTIHLTKSPGAFDCPFSGNDSNDFIVASFFFSFLLPGRVSTGRFESVQLTLYFVTGINDSRSNPSHELSRDINSLIVVSSKVGSIDFTLLALLSFTTIQSLPTEYPICIIFAILLRICRN